LVVAEFKVSFRTVWNLLNATVGSEIVLCPPIENYTYDKLRINFEK